MQNVQADNIDEYIAAFPGPIQKLLKAMRKAIKQAAPNAVEAIKYAIPTFVFHGNLVHFAAYKNHIGFYPGPSGIEEFEKETLPYQTGKGTLQFPIDKPLPVTLIGKIVKFRVKQNLEKEALKKLKKVKGR